MRRTLREVERYCMFVGYPRSGHSLVGALLNAHRHMVVAHELDALHYVDAGFSRKQLFSLLLRRDREFVGDGAVWTGYSYAVPGQWQGRFSQLRVIGDKKGGISALRIRHRPEVLDDLERCVGPQLAFVHVVRNPYDNIATMQLRDPHDDALDYKIPRYFEFSEGVAIAERFAGPDRFLTLRHEDLIANPHAAVQKLCRHVGVDCPDDYLEACASIVFRSPKQTRHQVAWSERQRALVQEGIERHAFLEGYAFDG